MSWKETAEAFIDPHHNHHQCEKLCPTALRLSLPGALLFYSLCVSLVALHGAMCDNSPVLPLLALKVVLLSRSKVPSLTLLLPPPLLSLLLPLLLWLPPLHPLVVLPSLQPIPLSLPPLLLALLLRMLLLALLKKGHHFHRLSALAPIEIRRCHLRRHVCIHIDCPFLLLLMPPRLARVLLVVPPLVYKHKGAF